MIGKTISHYKILEKLGEGGMGVVYKAEDTRLDRMVALKFLPKQFSINEEEKKRFIHEAKAAAALDHPNICTIHEIGETDDGQMFIAMACYEGETLKDKIEKGPLKINETLDIVIQIAKGLDKAHKKDIIHRDIKSANIIITNEGIPKILDFGLAKLKGVTKLTKEGTTLGTVAYMSPEQASGDKVDHRSDIWSLGVLLYEMITGQLPFKGEYEQAVIYSIMNEEPESVTGLRTGVPLELERIINKTLNKDPANRFQSCAELMVDLKLLAGELTPVPAIKKIAVKTKQKVKFIKIVMVTLMLAVIFLAFFLGKNIFTTKKNPQIKSIAVLPLENLSADREQEYFSDGMTDELIATLAKIKSLRVISRTSVMRYKKTDKSMPEIAKEMDVDYLIEGTVLRSAGRVRITVQLIEGKSDSHIWAESYKRDLQDVLILQSEVAMAIVREIKLELTTDQQERLLAVRRVNPKAHELYLQGRFHLSKFKKKGYEKAIKYFQKAIAIDPNYALAYVGLARAYGFGGYFGHIPLNEAISKNKKFLDRAFEIDDTIPEAHQVLATIKFYLEWDWAGAEEGFEWALKLNPNLVGNNEYAWYLAGMGRFDEAIFEAKRTLSLDPYSYLTNFTLAYMYYYARQYNQAISQWKKILELELNDIRSYANLAYIYAQMGKFEDAVINYQRAMTLSGATTEKITALGRAYNESGSRGYWTWFLERSKDQVYKAGLYTRLDDKDQAMDLLEKAYQKHHRNLWSINITPAFDPLRSDPCFQDLLRRMKFPEKKPVKTNSKRKINDR